MCYTGGVGCLRVLVILAALAPPAAAQTPAPADAEPSLARALDPGDRVSITMLDGRVERGRLMEVADGRIRMRQGEEVRAVEIEGVRKVRRTRFGVTLGTLIGLGVGVGLGAAVASLEDNEGASAAAGFAWTAGICTAAGLGIDAAINLPRTVYRRESSVAIAPIVGPRSAGVGVRLRF